MVSLVESLAPLASRRVILFGGKGGVGKTTAAVAAALAFAESRPTILFTTDPASNLDDLFGGDVPAGLEIESLQAAALYERFLAGNLESFIELGDRGTYLDREELRRLFELSLPGIDELMAWMRIGELIEQRADALLVVDTAPTGHTLRMLGSSAHFTGLAEALDAMQAKHRDMMRQFTRREVHDSLDDFIAGFEKSARVRSELLADPARAAFIPVALAEPLVVEQTLRLIAELRIDVPFVLLNRAIVSPDCDRDRRRMEEDAAARARLAPRLVVDAPRSCTPLDSVARIREWGGRGVGGWRLAVGGGNEGASGTLSPPSANRQPPPANSASLLFLAGKGGVGKTTCSAAIALVRAVADPGRRYVVISVDPAHSLRDVFAHEAPPANLTVETIDTKAKWHRFRESLGRELSGAMDALAPRGVTIAHDREAMEQLIEIAPPGADELFAITRLASLAGDDSLAGVIVDTAPTGHFLRLLDLPEQAGEWVREFMRLLLRYRELISPGTLGEELVLASRALRDLGAALRSERTAVVVVTRPERIVIAETRRLIDDLQRRGIAIGGVVANYIAPANDCACEQEMRRNQVAALESLGSVTALVERLEDPPSSLQALERLGRTLVGRVEP